MNQCHRRNEKKDYISGEKLENMETQAIEYKQQWVETWSKERLARIITDMKQTA